MARAQGQVDDAVEGPQFLTGELTIVAFPTATVKALSDQAAKRNHTLAQALKIAVELYLGTTK